LERRKGYYWKENLLGKFKKGRKDGKASVGKERKFWGSVKVHSRNRTIGKSPLKARVEKRKGENAVITTRREGPEGEDNCVAGRVNPAKGEGSTLQESIRSAEKRKKKGEGGGDLGDYTVDCKRQISEAREWKKKTRKIEVTVREWGNMGTDRTPKLRLTRTTNSWKEKTPLSGN